MGRLSPVLRLTYDLPNPNSGKFYLSAKGQFT